MELSVETYWMYLHPDHSGVWFVYVTPEVRYTWPNSPGFHAEGLRTCGWVNSTRSFINTDLSTPFDTFTAITKAQFDFMYSWCQTYENCITKGQFTKV